MRNDGKPALMELIRYYTFDGLFFDILFDRLFRHHEDVLDYLFEGDPRGRARARLFVWVLARRCGDHDVHNSVGWAACTFGTCPTCKIPFFMLFFLVRVTRNFPKLKKMLFRHPHGSKLSAQA